MTEWNEFVEQWDDKLLKPEIQFGEWWCIDPDASDLCPDDEEMFYPADLFTKEQVFDMHSDFVTRDDIKLRKGWGARLSAPGYLDSTTWALLPSEEEAQKYLIDNYDDDG